MKLNKELKFSFEIFSPVHIGSGDKFIRGLDFVDVNGKIVIFDNNLLLRKLTEEQLRIASDISKLEGIVRQLIERKEKEMQDVIKAKYNGPAKNEIFSFIRDPFSRPLIPGSSIKGALRTAILKERAEKENFKVGSLKQEIFRRKKFKDQPVIERLLRTGRGPHFDLMRFVKTEDLFFSKEDLDLYTIKIITAKRGGAQFIEGLNLSAEMLKPGVKGEMTLRIEDFPFVNPDAERKLRMKKFERELSQLPEILRNYAQKWIEKEENDLKKLKINVLQNFYVTLKEKITQGFIPFHIGFGTGWKAMTGDLIEEEEKESFIRKFELTRSSIRPFPASRKVICITGNKCMAPGWLMLKLI